MLIFKIMVILFMLFGVLLLVKNENAFKNYKIILEAMREYGQTRMSALCGEDWLTEFDFEVDPSDMEPYVKTLFRLWDWGYTRILPKDKFELIKPYIH